MKWATRFLIGVSSILLAQGALSGESNATPWRALFDGRDLNAWRVFNGKGQPTSGWEIQDGCLHLKPGGKGGQLVSVDAFDNYELEWEWKLAAKANNGLKYLVTESRTEFPGPEYQMVDDSTMRNPLRQTGTFYEVLPTQVPTKVNPPGEWNTSRVVIRGKHIEHWLNGVKVLAYELGSDEVKKAIAKSKFKDAPGFGDKIKGHILLTNHNNETWYRNIRIRELPGS